MNAFWNSWVDTKSRSRSQVAPAPPSLTMADEESKAEGEQKPGTMQLKVVSQDGTEVFFKCKADTKLEKLMRAFCQRQGVAIESVRFLFDGNRIRENQTPNELDMEDGDSIDVVVAQVGGSIRR